MDDMAPPPPPRIIGIVQCKNEWALVAVSITHALMHHVDEVHVLNDSSSDATFEGLARLGELWPGRIHVVHLHGGEFLQEAAANTAVHLCQASANDWIYVFDADEFLLLDGGRTLRQVIGELDDSCVGVRYGLRSFVSVEDFDECRLADYRRIHHRAIPNANAPLGSEWWAQGIYEERVTFFDYPFPPKIVFRNVEGLRPGPSTHVLVQHGPAAQGVVVDRADVWAAHLTYLTRRRLERKAAQGRRHVENGLPAWHGWQNQLAFRLSQEGKLERFWRRHSLPASGEPGPLSPRNLMLDDAFRRGIEPALAFLERGFRSEDLSRAGDEVIAHRVPEETLVPLQSVVRLAWKLIRGEKAAAAAATSERDAALRERDAAARERDAAASARVSVLAERDAAQAARDDVLAERDRLLRSWPWRLTAPLRKLAGLFAQLRSRGASPVRPGGRSEGSRWRPDPGMLGTEPVRCAHEPARTSCSRPP